MRKKLTNEQRLRKNALQREYVDRKRAEPGYAEKVRDYLSDYRKRNPDKIKAILKKCRGSEKGKKRSRDYQKSVKQKERSWRKTYKDKNPGLYNTFGAQRRALKLSRIHPGHNPAIEKFLHERAATLTELTGWKHGVDHIIPLARGGWHHHDNLQVLPLDLNSSKNDNPFWEHPEYCSWRDVPKPLWPEELAPSYQQLIAA